MKGGTGAVVLIMLGVLGLYLIWKTDIIKRIVGGAADVETVRPE
jgi:hypothetical protein